MDCDETINRNKDIFDLDLFTPMTEEEVNNFEKDLLPKNSAKGADEVNLSEAVKLISGNFDNLFGE
jgi:hypothetical protein